MVNAVKEVADFAGDVIRPVADAAADVLRPVGEAILRSDEVKTVVNVAAVATGNSWAVPIINGADAIDEGADPEDVLKTRLVGPRCGDFNAELLTSYEFDDEQTIRCFPCDHETPSGGGHPPGFNNILKIPIYPHKGDLDIERTYFIDFTMKLMDASDRARTYRFY